MGIWPSLLTFIMKNFKSTPEMEERKIQTTIYLHFDKFVFNQFFKAKNFFT